jgi:hypothetical protein
MCPICGSLNIISNEEDFYQPLCLDCGWTGPAEEDWPDTSEVIGSGTIIRLPIPKDPD